MSTELTEPPAPSRRRRRESDFTAKRHVYEPHKVGLPPLGPYVRELWRRREFAFELSRTNLRAQHFNTAFGQLWLVLNPLLLSGVYFVLIDIVRGGRQGWPFFAHLVAGIFAYHFVSGAMRQASKSVTSGGKLILNTAFPRALLPLSSVITSVKQFLPTMVVYIPFHLIAGLPVGWHLLWLIPIAVLLGVLAAGLAMFVSAAQVYFRDLRNLLPYVLRIWLYASPVLYYASEIPKRYAWILVANPLASLLTAWSDVLSDGHAPRTWSMLVGGGWAVLIFVAGAVFFLSRERDFAVRI